VRHSATFRTDQAGRKRNTADHPVNYRVQGQGCVLSALDGVAHQERHSPQGCVIQHVYFNTWRLSYRQSLKMLQMGKIGVTITSNFILLPEKSVTAISGIYG